LPEVAAARPIVRASQRRKGLFPVRWKDTKSGYGWISIALHWLTAAIVIAMWTIGTISQAAAEEDFAGLVRLHTTIGIGAYALLWGRIVWRFAVGHPGPRPGQHALLFPLARYFHLALLAAIGIMLITGPLMVWSNGEAIEFFGFAIASPLPAFPRTHDALRAIHGVTGLVILGGIMLHVLAVFKHAVLNRDGTFDKIMIADGTPRN
jgi:cytochrome b561